MSKDPNHEYEHSLHYVMAWENAKGEGYAIMKWDDRRQYALARVTPGRITIVAYFKRREDALQFADDMRLAFGWKSTVDNQTNAR